LRPGWNSFLKHKVRERLKEWFDQQGIAAPAITMERAAISSSENQTEALRSFVIECVKHMSRDELDRISIPSSAALRVKDNC
jgi:hypothetical protein